MSLALEYEGKQGPTAWPSVSRTSSIWTSPPVAQESFHFQSPANQLHTFSTYISSKYSPTEFWTTHLARKHLCYHCGIVERSLAPVIAANLRLLHIWCQCTRRMMCKVLMVTRMKTYLLPIRGKTLYMQFWAKNLIQLWNFKALFVGVKCWCWWTVAWHIIL